MVLLWFLLFGGAKGQTTIQGVVVDRDDKVVVGAKVWVKGTDLSIQSLDLGRFYMDTPVRNGVLMVSHVGYDTLEYVFSHSESDIKLILSPSLSSIDQVEVVYTGYQSLPKERATGSFAVVSQELLTERVESNILESIRGFMPSLQFEPRSSRTELHIRGLSSFDLTMTSPLIIVDNFPYEGDITNINPNDIESVTLLRDAAATSIWGTRAGNGVIVITRKKASVHHTSIQFRSGTKAVSRPDVHAVPSISSKDFIAVEQMLFDNGFYDRLLDPATNRYTLLSPVVDLLYRHRLGQESRENVDREIARLESIDYRDQLAKYLFRNGILQQTSLGFSVGKGSWAYRGSVGFDKKVGDKVNEGGERLSISNNFSYSPLNTITINLALDHSINKGGSMLQGENYPLRVGGGRTYIYPYAELIDSEGNALIVPKGYNSHYLATLGDHQLLDWTYQPLSELDRSLGADHIKHTLMNLSLSWDMTKWLKSEIRYGYEMQDDASTSTYGEDSYYVRDLVNTYTQVQNGNYDYPISRGAILDQGHGTMRGHRGRASLYFDDSWRGGHELTILGGMEVNSTHRRSSSFRVYGLNENVLSTIPVDYVNLYPTFDGLLGSQRIPYVDRLSEYNDRFVSFFSNMSYTYRSKYTLSASARRDASNIFGVNTNNRWNPLWSVGAAWNVSNENWLKEVEWLDKLRLKSTYGHSGNAGGVSTTLPVLYYDSPSSSWISSFPRAQITALPNANLKWEDVAMINIGTEFAVLNGKLGGSFEYYTKKAKDLLANNIMDPTKGFSQAKMNVGQMDGKGFDAELFVNIRNSHAISWHSSINLSMNRNTVKKYEGASVNGSFYTSNTGTMFNAMEGKSPYPVFAYRFAGLEAETGNPQGYFNGEISKDYRSMISDSVQNLRYYGSSMAPYFGSWRNNLKWRSFELSALITYKFGSFRPKETIWYSSLFNGWNGHNDYTLRWREPGDEVHTTVPGMVYPADTNRDRFYAQSEPNIYNADFIRLQDVRLSYAFGLKHNRKPSNMVLSAYINQVGVLWVKNEFGIDPENNPMPAQRNYGLAISWNY